MPGKIWLTHPWTSPMEKFPLIVRVFIGALDSSSTAVF